MVKRKGGRELNPADAYRKAQRAREIERNKKERAYQREALKNKDKPDMLRRELQGLLKDEDYGLADSETRIKRKALQTAYDSVVKRKREEELRSRGLIPEAQPAPGAMPAGMEMFLLTAPTERPVTKAAGDAPPVLSANVLPPPDEPPPAILPPPTHPPTPAPAPTPVYAPTAYAGAPPPRLPPPPVPPPIQQPTMHAAAAPRATIPLPGARRAQVTIAGEATAVPRPMAQDDAKVTSMVPAAVRVRREQAQAPKPVPAAARRTVVDASFGLAPVVAPPRKLIATQAAAKEPTNGGGAKKDVDSKYAEFMSAMGELGAFDG